MLSLTIFVFIALLMLFLGGVVFVHGPRVTTNRLFAVWVIFTVLWMVCNYLENVNAFNLQLREAFLHGDFWAAMIASGFIMLFTLKFLDKDVPAKKLVTCFLPAAVLSLASLTPWLFSDVYLAGNADIRFTEGPIFYVYAPVTIAYLVLPSIFMLRRRMLVKDHRRGQITPVAIGLAVSTLVSLIINLFFQNVLSADLFRIGIYVWLFFIIGVSWSIGRHKFLNVRFVIVEILLLGILATMVTRTILSVSLSEVMINTVSLTILLILGFAMIRSFLNEERQKIEVQKLATELAASNKRLRQLDDLKTTMVSIASHQIRGPLGGIRGYLTMFRDGDLGAINDKQKEIVTLNLNVTTRLLNAVETFLDITKLESGALTLRKEVLPLDEAVKDVHDEFLLPASKKGIALSLAFDCERPVWVEFDPEKIKHVIFNLIDNALKYTERGSIAVRVRCAAGEAIFEVTDTGMGITPEDAPRLFGKYQRGELVIDRGGSGLGLYVVKMLTEMQGGRIWASSPGIGKGSTFGFALPLSRHL